MESYWVEVAVLGRDLREDGGNRVVRPVSLDYDGVSGVEVGKDGGRGERFLEGVKGLLTLRGPRKRVILAGKAVHRGDYVGIVGYETAVKIGKT